MKKKIKNIEYNPASKDGLRWVENVSLGLRFTGFCDEITHYIRHTGWYIDDIGAGDTYRGVVYQLATRNGMEQYVAGYADPWSGDCARVDFATIHRDKTAAAYAANKLAETNAAIERHYNEAWQAGAQYADIVAEIQETRKETHDLLLAVKAERQRAVAPVICNTLRASIKQGLYAVKALRQKRDKLASGYDGDWYPDQRVAFNEGAGATVLA